MIKILSLIFSLTLMFSLSTITLADSSKSNREHFYQEPYQCLMTKISKRSGKERNSLYYYHPEKNWTIKLLTVKSKGSVKVATFKTTEGQYAGVYDGVYPDIKKIEFHTFWPNQKRFGNTRFSKLKKENCQLVKDLSIFNLPANTESLACMDIRKTGICETLKK